MGHAVWGSVDDGAFHEDVLWGEGTPQRHTWSGLACRLPHKTSSAATDREEIEANAFAASLLMPSGLVRSELQRLSAAVSQDPERCTTVLAAIFDVSD
ncbi:hypothetical protein KN815_08670 [Streptomyces sp. 4503]|uniref:Uncharacterized protein n=1 Tax=Streptomyces niphimycinicus TaxID=2842201 RepID=A0ABS6CB95_9ACTN|nr:hypothetical protein [Streptomyces niphimycinicus]MBU3864148.1 hypothetical protein [Streptomyces niphimycinicus]